MRLALTSTAPALDLQRIARSHGVTIEQVDVLVAKFEKSRRSRYADDRHAIETLTRWELQRLAAR